MFEIINNTNKLLGDDLKNEIKQGSRLRIAASCFSIYAYDALKNELSAIDELKFLFTTPTLIAEQIKDKVKKQQREFYIPKLSESGLCGTEFEIRLKNRMTQKRTISKYFTLLCGAVGVLLAAEVGNLGYKALVDKGLNQPLDFLAVGAVIERNHTVSVNRKVVDRIGE